MSGQEYKMDIERGDGEPLGVQVDASCVITKVTPTSLSDGELNVGDRVLSVNETIVKSKEHMFQLLRYAHPRLRIVVKRGAGGGSTSAPSTSAPSTSAPSASAPNSSVASVPPGEGSLHGISTTVEKMIRRRPGYDYQGIEIDWESNRHLALGIVLSNRMHRVIVTHLKPGSLGEQRLKLLDRILAVNGTPVSDKDVAKSLIIQSGGKFNVTIERGLTEEAKKEFTEVSKAPPVGPQPVPSTLAPPPTSDSDTSGLGPGDTSILPVDVLEILRCEIMVLRGGGIEPQPGILRQQLANRKSSRLLIRSQSRESFIKSDIHPAARIRHVPKADPENLLPKEANSS